jgi:hypothetical protein
MRGRRSERECMKFAAVQSGNASNWCNVWVHSSKSNSRSDLTDQYGPVNRAATWAESHLPGDLMIPDNRDVRLYELAAHTGIPSDKLLYLSERLGLRVHSRYSKLSPSDVHRVLENLAPEQPTAAPLGVTDPQIIQLRQLVAETGAISQSLHNCSDLTDWFYDEFNGYGYLLLGTRDESILGEVLAHLEAGGIHFGRHGPSRYPASNGRQYLTYVRVATINGATPQTRHLRKALAPLRNGLHYDASPSEVREYCNSLIAGISRLKDAVEQSVQRITTQHSESLRLSQLYSDSQQAIRALNKRLDEIGSQTRSAEAGVLRAADKELVESLRAELHNGQEWQSFLAEEHARMEAENRALSAERNALATKLDGLVQTSTAAEAHIRQLMAALSGKASAVTESRSRADRLGQTCGVLFQRAELVGDTLHYMANEMTDVWPTLAVIHAIDSKGKIRQKRFTTADGWFEVDDRIPNGTSDDTRVYYSPIKDEERVKVYVSCKSEQERDGQRMRCF